jgi:hypothetical protein
MRGYIVTAILAALALLCLFVVLRMSPPAAAHSWYTDTNDPMTGMRCCGGHDCAPISSEWVQEVKGGYRLVMTLEQARTVNKAAQYPVDTIIPYARVQSPPENAEGSEFYACISATTPNQVYCFFATPSM